MIHKLCNFLCFFNFFLAPYPPLAIEFKDKLFLKYVLHIFLVEKTGHCFFIIICTQKQMHHIKKYYKVSYGIVIIIFRF